MNAFAVLQVKVRAGGKCERCAVVVPTNAGLHQRLPQDEPKPRKQLSRDSRRWDPSALAVLCQECTRWIGRYPAKAFRAGWSVARSATPADVPVQSRLHGYVRFGSDGTIHEIGGLP